MADGHRIAGQRLERAILNIAAIGDRGWQRPGENPTIDCGLRQCHRLAIPGGAILHQPSETFRRAGIEVLIAIVEFEVDRIIFCINGDCGAAAIGKVQRALSET
jgi:hypothetical protein